MTETPTTAKPARSWSKAFVEIAAAFLIVLAAKGAIAEPFYVPSGSMEPTLLIGDALLASKYPYGYSTASLPSPCRAATDSSAVRIAAQSRRRRGVPLAGRYIAGLGQARDRIAGRSCPDA